MGQIRHINTHGGVFITNSLGIRDAAIWCGVTPRWQSGTGLDDGLLIWRIYEVENGFRKPFQEPDDELSDALHCSSTCCSFAFSFFISCK
jgi:hypothetical protein